MKNIQTLETISELESKMPILYEQSLIIFDVGNVLLKFKSPLFNAHYESVRNSWHERLCKTYDKETFERLWSILLQKEYDAIHLVEEQTPTIIKKLQQSKVKVMALTRTRLGNIGKIPSHEDLRISKLIEHGIDFSLSAPISDQFVLKEVVSQRSFPIYKNGILFVEKELKGIALDAFLSRIDWNPSIIFFVDDKIDYLKYVQTTVEERGIPFIGFHYTANLSNLLKLDENVLEQQFKHLIEHDEWLSEEEIYKLNLKGKL
jgi:hypothetical protein